jgi:hypothetical protein
MKQNSVNITGFISPTQKQAEGRSPVSGSEFTTKAAPKGGFSRIRSYTESKFRGSACVRGCVVRNF